MQLLPALAGRSQTRHWRIGDRSIPWQVASQQSLPPFPPAKSFQPNTAANATIGHRSMPKQIHRRLRADRPFVSSERSRQPESPHSGVAHLAPEYWPTFCPELTLDNRVAKFSQFQRLGNSRVSLFVHPCWPIGPGPDTEMIVLSKSMAFAKISAAKMVQPSTHINLLIQQQSDHHERAVVAIKHDDIPSHQRRHHLSQQCGFTCFL